MLCKHQSGNKESPQHPQSLFLQLFSLSAALGVWRLINFITARVNSRLSKQRCLGRGWKMLIMDPAITDRTSLEQSRSVSDLQDSLEFSSNTSRSSIFSTNQLQDFIYQQKDCDYRCARLATSTRSSSEMNLKTAKRKIKPLNWYF